MKTCLLLISDGRDEYLRRTLTSAADHLPPMDFHVHIDDADHELGFGGAIQAGWEQALATEADFIFHLEQDFEFLCSVPLFAMIQALEEDPRLVQMALLRQPWSEREKAAGGIVELDPDNYADWGEYLVHRNFFTTNPSVYPRWVAERGWPDGDQSEGHFGLGLFQEEPDRYAAFWGNGEPWVHHIGDERAGKGY